jgi:CBS domain containing-hemolysin-like protein
MPSRLHLVPPLPHVHGAHALLLQAPPGFVGPGPEVALILISALVGALLSALTTALATLPPERVLALRDEGGPDGKTAARLVDHRKTIRARILAGRVLSVASVSAFTAHLVALVLEDEGLVLSAVFGAALAYAILAEIAQTLARSRANTITLPLLRACYPLELLLAPFAIPIQLVARLAERYFPEDSDTVAPQIAEREVEHLIEKREEEGTLEGADMLLNVLELKDTFVREVMVPRTRMVAISKDTPIASVIEHAIAEGHSRYPVYGDKVDRIEGVVYTKDLFAASRAAEPPPLSKIVRSKVLFVPETQKINALLREMQQKRQHLAIVIDEFGGTSGIVTLEDVLEEIVGEIHDEHDTEEALVTEVEPGRYVADARVSIHDLGEMLSASLVKAEEAGFDSLGGLVIDLAGGVPEVGKRVRLDGFDFVVKDADERRVRRVEIQRRDSLRPSAPEVTTEAAPATPAPSKETTA